MCLNDDIFQSIFNNFIDPLEKSTNCINKLNIKIFLTIN